MEKDKFTLNQKLEYIQKEYPVTPHTGIGRLFTCVRRMKAEKEWEIPVENRLGFAISVETGKHANEMDEEEWEKFFGQLSGQLKRDYPDMWERLFGI